MIQLLGVQVELGISSWIYDVTFNVIITCFTLEAYSANILLVTRLRTDTIVMQTCAFF